MNALSAHVLSIWHTGTRSTLEYYGLPQDHEHYTHLRKEYDGMYAKRAADMHEHLIMPLRDPFQVWESWNKRSHVKYGRPNGGANNPAVFHYVWQLAYELWQQYTVHLLPVDLPSRSQHLALIEQLTPLRPVVKDFPHVTDSIAQKPCDYSNIDWPTVYGYVQAMGIAYEARATHS